RNYPAALSRAAITMAALAGVVGLAGCGSSSSDDHAEAPPKLACDDSIQNEFKPDENTTVLLVKEFKKGDPLLLAGAATEQTPVAENDLCLVKLNVGPGNPGPEDALSTSPGIGMEIWLPKPENWNNRLHAVGNGGWAGSAEGQITAIAGGIASDMRNAALIAGTEGAISVTSDM